MLFKPDFRFIPCAMHTNPLKEKWIILLIWLSIMKETVSKRQRVRYENLCELNCLLGGFETKNVLAKYNVLKVKNKCLHAFGTLNFFRINDLFLIDYNWYQSTIFCLFRAAIYLITKMHLASHCNVFFLQKKIVVSNSSRICAKTSYNDDLHGLQHLRLQLNIISQYIFQLRSKNKS